MITHTEKQLTKEPRRRCLLEKLKTSPIFTSKSDISIDKYRIIDAKQYNNFLLLNITCQYWSSQLNQINVLINLDEDFSDDKPPSQFNIKRYEKDITVYVSKKLISKDDGRVLLRYCDPQRKSQVNYEPSNGKLLKICRKINKNDKNAASEIFKHIFILKNKIVDLNPENSEAKKDEVSIYNIHDPSQKKTIKCKIPEHIYFPKKKLSDSRETISVGDIKNTFGKVTCNCTDTKIIFIGLSYNSTDKQKNTLYVFDAEEAYSSKNEEICFREINFSLEIQEKDLYYTKKKTKYTEYENMLLHKPQINITKTSGNIFTLNIMSDLYNIEKNIKYKDAWARKSLEITDPGSMEQFRIRESLYYQYTPKDHCHNIHNVPMKTQDNHQLVASFPTYYDNGYTEKILKCEIFDNEGDKVKDIDCAELKKYIKELENFKRNLQLQFFSFDKTLIRCQIGNEIIILYDLENEKIIKKFISYRYMEHLGHLKRSSEEYSLFISPMKISSNGVMGLSNKPPPKRKKTIAKDPSLLKIEKTPQSERISANQKLLKFSEEYSHLKIDLKKQQKTSQHLNGVTSSKEKSQKKSKRLGGPPKGKIKKRKKSSNQINFKQFSNIELAIKHIFSKNILLTAKNISNFYQTFHFTGLQQLANAIIQNIFLSDDNSDDNINKHVINNFLLLMYYQIEKISLNLKDLPEHIKTSFKKERIFFLNLMFCRAYKDSNNRSKYHNTRLSYSSSNQTEKLFLRLFKEKEELFEKLFLRHDTTMRKCGSVYTRLSIFLKSILNPSCCIFLLNLLNEKDWCDLLFEIIYSIDDNAFSSKDFLKIISPKDLKMLLFNTKYNKHRSFLYLFLRYSSNAELLAKLISTEPFRKTVLSFKKNRKSKSSRKKNKTTLSTTHETEFYKIWLQVFDEYNFNDKYFIIFYRLFSITDFHQILKSLFNKREFVIKIEKYLLKFSGDNIDKTTWLLKFSEKLYKYEISLLNPENIFLPLLFKYKRNFKNLFSDENSITSCINHLAFHSFGNFLLLLLSPKMMEISDIMTCLTSKEHANNWLNAFFSIGEHDNLTLTSTLYDRQHLIERWNIFTEERCLFNRCYPAAINKENFFHFEDLEKLLPVQRFLFILKNKFFAKVFSELNVKFFDKASLNAPSFLLDNNISSSNDNNIQNEEDDDNDNSLSNDNNIQNEEDDDNDNSLSNDNNIQNEDNDNSLNTYNNTKKALFSLLSTEKGNEILFDFLEKTYEYLHKPNEKKKKIFMFDKQIIKNLLLKYFNEWFLKYLKQTQKKTKFDDELSDDFNDDYPINYHDKDHFDDSSRKVVSRGALSEFKLIKNLFEYFKIFNLNKEKMENTPAIQTEEITKKLNLSWLKILDLSNSKIKFFDVNNCNLSNLEILNLSNNKILHLKIDGNYTFHHLRMLFARKNLLIDVEITDCRELRVIDLSFNQLGLKPGSLHISNSCTKVKSLLLDSNEYNNNIYALPILPEKCKAKVILRKHPFSNLTKCLIRRKYNDVILDKSDFKKLTIMSMPTYTAQKTSEHTTIYKYEDMFHIEEEIITKRGNFEKRIIQYIALHRITMSCNLEGVEHLQEKLIVHIKQKRKKFINLFNSGYTFNIVPPLKSHKERIPSRLKGTREYTLETSRNLNCKIGTFYSGDTKDKPLTKSNLKILLEQHIDKLLDSEIKKLRIYIFNLIRTIFISRSFSEKTLSENKIIKNSAKLEVIRKNSAKFFEEKNFILFVVKNVLQANLLDCLKNFKKMESSEESEESEKSKKSEKSEEKKFLKNLLHKEADNLSPKEIFRLIENVIDDKTESVHEKIDVLIYEKISIIVKDIDEALRRLNEEIEANLKQISIKHKGKETKIEASLSMFELSKQRYTKMYEKNTFLKIMVNRTIENKKTDYHNKNAKKFIKN